MLDKVFYGILCVIAFPVGMYHLGRWSVRRQLIKNIDNLKQLKEESSEEIQGLIEIHLEELKKLDDGVLKEYFKKNI